MKKRISSPFTTLYRTSISLLILLMYSLSIINIISKHKKTETALIDYSTIKAILIIHIFLLIALYIFNRFKNVWMDNEYLYISDFFKKDVIPFTNMECITAGFGIITIYFKRKTPFGKMITFAPILFMPLFIHPVAEELKSKIVLDPEMSESLKKSFFYSLFNKR